MTPADLTNKGCWVVDRKISLGLILAIVIHATAVVGWLVRMEARVGELERTDSRHEVTIQEVQKMAVCMEGMRSDIRWMRDSMAAAQKK